jgi:hypothetical protein
VKLAGNDVAVELAGLMHNHARRLTKDRNRAAKLAAHAYMGEDMADPEIVELIARSVCTDLQRIMSTCSKVYVVAEGNFTGKRHENARRRMAAVAAVAKKDWKKTVAVTDCMVARVREWVGAQSGAEWVQPPGEGESQIMHMLWESTVGVGLIFSGDSDVSIYDGCHGVVVSNIDIQGSVGGRKRGGAAGVQIWGKQIELSMMWKTANGGGDDLSAWSMADKAIFAAIIGCDYSEDGTGVPGKGHATALKDVVKLRSNRGWQSSSNYVISSFKALCKDEAMATKLTVAALRYLYHPVLSLKKTMCEPYTKMDEPATAFFKAADQPLYEQLRDLGMFDPTCAHPHLGCSGCNAKTGILNLDSTRTTGATKTAAPTTKGSDDGWSSTTKQAQPELSSTVMNAFFTLKSKAENIKHQHEGMCRCFDDPLSILEGLATKGDPPKIKLRSKVAQSQARGYYTPTIEVETDRSGAVIKHITGSSCTCTKWHAETICKHRAALMMFMYLNTAQGYAGSPTDRAAYWKDRGGKVLSNASNQVMRTVDVLTQRAKMPKMKELLEMEANLHQPQPAKRRRTRSAATLADSESEPDSDAEPAVTLEDARDAMESSGLVGKYRSLSARVSAVINKHCPPLVGGRTKMRGAIADARKAAAIVQLHKKYAFVKRISRKADALVTASRLKKNPTYHPVHGVYDC